MTEPRKFVTARPNRLFFKHIVRKIFLEDWGLKLTALVITLGLWFGVTGLSTPTTERMSGVPLALRNSNDKEITNPPTTEVDIVVSGDKRKIAQINKNDLVVSVDISDLSPGDYVVSLDSESVALSLPTGVRLEKIEPNKIPVRLEAVDERDVEVRAETTGQPPEGYELYYQTVTPTRVLVRGPAGFVRALESISTEAIDLTGHITDFTARQVPVSVSNNKAIVLQTAVDVAYRIGEKRVVRQYRVPVKDARAKVAIVVLFGGRSLFDGVKADQFRIDVSKNDSGEELPKLTLPEKLQDKVEVRQVKLQ